MRKLFLIFGIMGMMVDFSHATHLFGTNANNITAGTLDPRRVDPSTFTLWGDLGNKFNSIGTDTTTVLNSIGSFPPREYTLYVGTPGTPEVDFVYGGNSTWSNMISSVQAHGLTYRSSVSATIFLSPGIYSVSGGTIPVGINIFAVPGSSTVLRPTGDNIGMLTLWGGLHNVQVDMQGRAYTAKAFNISTGAAINEITVNGADAMSQTVAGMTLFNVRHSTSWSITGTINSYAGTTNDTPTGGIATVVFSSAGYINLKTRGGALGGSVRQYFYFQGAGDVVLDGRHEGGGRYVVIDGGNKDIQVRGQYRIRGATDGNGFVMIKSVSGGSRSTSTVIEGQYFVDTAVNSSPIIGIQDGILNDGGVLITNAIAADYASGGTPAAFISVGTNVARTICSNVHAYGMPLISDSGNSTLCSDMATSHDGIKD